MSDLDHHVFCQCRKHQSVLAGAENTDLDHLSGREFQRAFPLDILMVHTSALAISTDGEHLTCGGLSLSKTVHLGSFEFIIDFFGGLSLSSRGNNSGTGFIGTTHNGPPSPRRP
jgi:hypothetical protein